ncbi:MAG TPA: TerB family tellurite resistance protein [Rhodoblastus sp.]|nr:TerB family tellurite resistance protein [Rhodoblastus sp.]
MLGRLKDFFDELTGASPKQGFAPDDYRVAAAALLVHMANADGHVAPQEQRRLRRILEARFELDAGAARELMRRAEESEREAIDLYQFTSVLKRALDEPGRLAVVELLWDVAFADGHADELEENTVWRVAELLGVSGRDRMRLKRKAEKAGVEPMPENPWDDEGSGI